MIKLMTGKKSKKDEAKKQKDKNYDEVITTHINADFDALASVIAASKLYTKAALVFPGSQEKNLRDFFLQTTSYLFNFTKIKQLDFDRIKRLILVDTRQKGRIGKFAELVDKEDVEIHIYDHHPKSRDDIHGVKEVIRKIGSATALLTGLIREKSIPISPEEATIMCLGIHEDTGSFTFSSTTPEDYLAAAWLAEQGADHNTISDMLIREMTAEQVWLLNDLTQSATTRVINGIEIVFAKVIRDEYIGDFAVLVHKLMEMENLNVVFALAQMEDRIHLVARSRLDEVNVAEIATALGGGGHPQAASATIRNKTLIQVERSLQALLRNRTNPIKKTRDVMSSPAIHIHPREAVGKASDLMIRYNINVLLVIDDKEGLKGFITRQVVEKAVSFGLGKTQVREYMNIEFTSVHPDASLKEVQGLIVKNKLRVLPVVEREDVLGVITRTDLLNILFGEPLSPDFLYDLENTPKSARIRNMAAVMKERLPKRIISLLKDFGHNGDLLGYNVYLVGGLVRDIFLKHENLDVDIVIEGDGIKFAREYAEQHNVRVRSHQKFGTAVLVFPDGFKVDVATARMEYYKSPGAPPVVEKSSLKSDLSRRDFTINTLAVRLNKRHYGDLIDYFGAQKDIKEKVLRVLHNLSFVEDPTRMLRAVRFEQRFGFKIGKLTFALIKNAVKINRFTDFAGHRLFSELRLVLNERDPLKAINRMNELRLLQFINPELQLSDKSRMLLEKSKEVIAWYTLLYLEGHFEAWKIYWYGLTSSLDSKSFIGLTEKMEVMDLNSRKIISQREEIYDLLDNLYRFDGDNYQLYMLLVPYDTELLLHIMAKANNDRVKRLISSYFTKLKGTKIQLRGKDISAMGFQPGPIFNKIFDSILEARLNNRIRTKEDELRFVKNSFQPS